MKRDVMTKEQQIQLKLIGYDYAETMKMVKLKRAGHSYAKIGSVVFASRHTVRYQLAAYERVTSEILPKNSARKQK